MHREESIKQLKEQSFDLLVIGGGATGAGIALDAATRGLKVALIEKDDFASGTSSKSTKLIHGGVRYLEQAVKKLDRVQLNLVRDALHERATLLKIAPHLTRPLAILTPLYKWYEGPYYRIGLKMYDWLAGRTNLIPSRWMKREEALQKFPMLKKEGLRGGVVYADGQFDDARMNVSIALTAAEEGAVVINHMEVLALQKKFDKISGAIVKDRLGNGEFSVQAKVVINATGPFVDSIRKMDDPQCAPLLTASSGVHIVLDPRFCPPDTGLLIPKTDDGRVLFVLPWLGHTLVGTTDNPAKIETDPKPSEEDILYILHHIKKYLGISMKREEVLSAWSGLRPLVSDPKAADTARLSRDHIVQISPSGLLTITGGKWTTYRKMALDAVNEAIGVGKLSARSSRTHLLPLVGAARFSPLEAEELEKKFGIPPDVAHHLARSYGDRASKVAQIAKEGTPGRLAPHHPFLEAEVVYGVREEKAETVTDVLARRTRLAFLDQAAALKVLPRVVELMGNELKWEPKRREQEKRKALDYFSY
ncbi:MAG: FAD-dependent oxidoreductase [bacterium]